MIKIFLCFLFSSIAKVITPCENIHPNVLTPLKEIAFDMNRIGFPLKINSNKTRNSICQKTTSEYFGVCITYNYNYSNINKSVFEQEIDKETETAIYISHRLLFTPNTLFNVLYHEILHFYSAEHSQYPGLMNYSVKKNKFNLVSDDFNKLYPSIYDIRMILNSDKSIRRKFKMYKKIFKI
jgi:hypothetical protein